MTRLVAAFALLGVVGCESRNEITGPGGSGDRTVVSLMAHHDFTWAFNDEGNAFQMYVGQTYEMRIHNEDEDDAHGFSGIPAIGMDGAYLFPGDTHTRIVTPTQDDLGTHFFTCSVACGDGHDEMVGAIRVAL